MIASTQGWVLGSILCLTAFTAVPACTTTSDGGGVAPNNRDDIRYVWPDEGRERRPSPIEGSEGFIGPHKSSVVAAACANLSACIHEIGIAICVATAREYWSYRDANDAARVLQQDPLRWEAAPLSAATAIDCLTAASTCTEIKDCVSREGACGICEGEHALFCPEPEATLGFRVDCGAAGLQCVEGNDALSLSCGTGSCNLNEKTCASEQLSTCENGIAKTIACDSGELQCQSEGSEEAWCQGVSGPCDPGLETGNCSGQTARNCIGGGWSERNCDFLGSENSHKCQASAQGSAGARCIFNEGCDPDTYEETCLSGKISICPSGRPIQIDCNALGHLACDLQPLAGCRD